MKNRLMTGIIAGSIIGASAGMYAASRMSPSQRRRVIKRGRKVLRYMMDNMGLF